MDDRQVGGWMNGQMEEWMDVLSDEWMVGALMGGQLLGRWVDE